MKEITNLKDLMVLYLLSLHDTELQWSYIQNDNVGTIASRDLRKIVHAGSASAAQHAAKLEEVLKQLDQGTRTQSACLVNDIAREAKELRELAVDSEVVDAGMIVIHQCMNHYLVARYGALASFARMLQYEHIANALHQIMEEEKEEDEALSRLAEEKVNAKAKAVLS